MLFKIGTLFAVAVVLCEGAMWDSNVRRYNAPHNDVRGYQKRVKVFLYPTDEYLEDRYLRRGYQPYDSTMGALPADDWRSRGDIWHYVTRRPRVEVGRGRYRLLGRSDAAELQCIFPEDEHEVVSNIIWTRSDLTEDDLQNLSRLDAEIPDHYTVVTNDGQGSTLYLNHVTSLDTGLYRCMATARSGASGIVQTIYQDVDFYPDV